MGSDSRGGSCRRLHRRRLLLCRGSCRRRLRRRHVGGRYWLRIPSRVDFYGSAICRYGDGVGLDFDREVLGNGVKGDDACCRPSYKNKHTSHGQREHSCSACMCVCGGNTRQLTIVALLYPSQKQITSTPTDLTRLTRRAVGRSWRWVEARQRGRPRPTVQSPARHPGHQRCLQAPDTTADHRRAKTTSSRQ